MQHAGIMRSPLFQPPVIKTEDYREEDLTTLEK